MYADDRPDVVVANRKRSPGQNIAPEILLWVPGSYRCRKR